MEKLLRLLEHNARLTNAQLASMLNMSEGDVGDAIAAYEKAGVIRAYKTMIDWEETDREYVTAVIELKVSPKQDLGFDGIAETIMRLEEVESVYLMSGGFDLMVVVGGRTFKDVAMFVAKRLSTLDSVLSTATHFLLRRYKDHGVMLTRKAQDERVSP